MTDYPAYFSEEHQLGQQVVDVLNQEWDARRREGHRANPHVSLAAVCLAFLALDTTTPERVPEEYALLKVSVVSVLNVLFELKRRQAEACDRND